MPMERAKFMEILKDSYSAYYNIAGDVEETELPLAFRAEYYSRAEKYWLSKEITVWANETNEHAYVFEAESFDVETADKCIEYAINDMLPKVKPHKEHQYTNVKVLLIAESTSRELRKYIKKKSFSKNYNHSLYGFTTLHAAAVDLAEEKAYTNSAGHGLTKYFSKLFAAQNKTAKVSGNKKHFLFKE